jgi:exodeoxyribonuclease VII small subunit
LALEEIGTLLEEGDLTLEESLRGYELGVLMARRCEKMLNDAELRIVRLDVDTDG